MDVIVNGDKKAVLTIKKDYLEIDLIKQIQKMLTNPSINNVAIMPDCHSGTGCCVGFTSILEDKITPSIVGGDIGCGICVYPLGDTLKHKNSYKRIEKKIRDLIPTGNGYEHIHENPIISEEQYEDFFEMAKEEAVNFSNKYKEKFNVDISCHIPNYSKKWFSDLCEKIGSNYGVILRTMGTLGGGNHFIEINTDNTEHYISVHSGSRELGMKVCQYHQKKVNPSYIEGKEAYEYYFDMIFAQMFARINRRTIISAVIMELKLTFDSEKLIESIHNYIDFNDMVIRKGAISAHKDKLCVVSLNMRDGVLICKGKGNKDWNYSAAHGSGRILSRMKAKNKITLKEYEKSMSEVYSTCINEETIDEAPMVYKDSEFIKSALQPTVDIIRQLKTVVNIK